MLSKLNKRIITIKSFAKEDFTEAIFYKYSTNTDAAVLQQH